MVEWLALGCVRVCVFVFPSAVGLLGPARCAAQRAASGVEWSGSRFGRGRVLLSGRSPPFRVYFLFHEYIESCCRVGPHRFASIFCLTNIYIYIFAFFLFLFSSLFSLFPLSHTLSRALSLSRSFASLFFLHLCGSRSPPLSSPSPSPACLVPPLLRSRLLCVCFLCRVRTDTGAFGRSVLEQVLSSHVSSLREELRHEMRNLHVDMLRQFHSLQVCASACGFLQG